MSGLTITPAGLHDLAREACAALDADSPVTARGMLRALMLLTSPAQDAPRIIFTGPGAATLAAEEAQPAHAHHLPAGPAEAVPDGRDPPAAAGDPPAPEAPPPAQAAAGRPGPTSKWTPARLALLRREFPTCTDREALLARINALPGEPVASVDSLRKSAHFFDITATAETVLALRVNGGVRGGRRTAGMRRLPAREPKVRTPARVEAFPALWNNPHLTVSMVMAQLNTLPGERIKAGQQLYGWAKKAGLPTQRPMPEQDLPAPEPEPAPEPAAEPAHDAAPAGAPAAAPQPAAMPTPAPAAPVPLAAPIAAGDEKADVLDAFDSGMTVRQVERDFGIPLSTLTNWHAEWKRKQEKAA